MIRLPQCSIRHICPRRHRGVLHLRTIEMTPRIRTCLLTLPKVPYFIRRQLSQFSPAALPAIPDSPVQPWTAVPVTAVSRAAAVTESPLPSPDEEDILLELPLAPHERTRPVSDNATVCIFFGVSQCAMWIHLFAFFLR